MNYTNLIAIATIPFSNLIYLIINVHNIVTANRPSVKVLVIGASLYMQ